MDSIVLLDAVAGHIGEMCQVSISTGDVYTGIYKGFAESTKDYPLTLRLAITKQEAIRIGMPKMPVIGIPFDVIVSVKF